MGACSRDVSSTLPMLETRPGTSAPWDVVVNKGETTLAFGHRIPDNVVVQYFKYHKVTVGAEPIHGDPCEEAPFAAPS
jgi:hypothetical protein